MPKASPIPQAAIGVRAHSGWAALVAVTGSAGSPHVIARRRIEIADPEIGGSKQPYHAAEPMDFADAKAYLGRCTSSTRRLAADAIQTAIDGLRDKGHRAVSCAIILGSGRTLPELEKILASHAMIHTAEGEFFRRALVEAAEHCGLAVLGVTEREAYQRAAAQFRLPGNEIEKRVAAMGKGLGPPWTQDQKYATLVAWMALAQGNRRAL